jgi:hypothetical protein
MADILEKAEADLTPQMQSLINMLWDEWKLDEEQIKNLALVQICVGGAARPEEE